MIRNIKDKINRCGEILESLLMKNPAGTLQVSRGILEEARDCFTSALETAEDAQKALNLYRAFMENVRDGVILVRLLDRKIIDANNAAAELYGYTREELLSLRISDLRAAAERDQIKEQLAKAAAEGILFQTEHVRKDGSVLPVEVNSSGVILNGEKVLISIIRDITDRRKAETALRESESRLRLIIENSPDRIFQQDQGLKYTWYSGAPMEGMPFYIIGRTDYEIFPPGSARLLTETKTKVLESGQGARLQLYLPYQEKEFYYDCFFEPMRDSSGRVTGIAGYIRDITEQKKSEEIISRELARISLLRNIASASAGTLSIGEICSRVMDEVRRNLNAKSGCIFYLDKEENSLIRLAVFGVPEEVEREIQNIPLDSDSNAARIINYNIPVITHESPGRAESSRARLKKAGLEDSRWFALPIMSRGETLGVFTLAFEGVRSFTEEETGLYRAITEQLGIAIRNARLFQEEVESRKQARYELEISNFLLRAADVLTATIDMQKVLNSLADIALEITRRKRVIIGLFEKGEIVIMVSRGPLSPAPGKRWRIEGLSFYFRQAIEERQIITADYDRESSREALDKMDIDRSRLAILVPMLFSGRFIGILMVDSPDEKKDFTRREMELLEGIASQAAISLENARLYRERRQAEKEYRRIVHRYGLILQSAGEGILGLDRSGNHTFVNGAAAEMLGWKAEELIGRKSHPMWHYAHEDGTPYPENECRIYQTLREGTTSQANDEVFWRKDGTSFPVEYTTTPILEEDTIVGSVVTFRDITDRKKAEDWLRDAYSEITRSVHELEERNREIGLLSEMGSLLQACVDEEEAHSIIARFSHQMFSADSGAVYLLAGEKNLLEAIASWGSITDDELVITPAECWGLRLGKTYDVENIKTDIVCPHIRHTINSPYLCIPMMAQGETLGLLHLELESETRDVPPDTRERIRSHKRRFASAVAEDMALALANFRLRNTLYYQSIHDPLTGLFNRRYMQELLEKELLRTARKESSLGLIMIDIDYFKEVNDRFGHEAGDAYLRELGLFLQRNIRGGDYACRYGGEEFLVILPETDLEVTKDRAEQLLERARKISVTYRDQSIGPVTLSMGISAFPDCGQNADELLRAADSGLYRAKSEGRNRVMLPS